MKKILLIITLINPLITQAQFVVGAEGMTIKSGAVFTVDSLVLQTTSDVTITSNQLQHTGANVPVNTGNSIDRVYTFTSPVNFTGTAGFFYKDAELGANVESGLQLAYSATNAGSVWVTTSGSIVNATTNFISNKYSNVPLSRITASSSVTPLPVTILDFNASKNDAERTSLLKWDVANEIQIDHYNVERSIDGANFIETGKVMATGHNKYSFTDAHPETGINYYRLQIVEQNGSFKYSAIRQLYFGMQSRDIKVYPNPVVTEVNIHTNDATLTGTEGIVVDISGKVISIFKLIAGETILKATSWPAGTYLIKLASGKMFKVEKL